MGCPLGPQLEWLRGPLRKCHCPVTWECRGLFQTEECSIRHPSTEGIAAVSAGNVDSHR